MVRRKQKLFNSFNKYVYSKRSVKYISENSVHEKILRYINTKVSCPDIHFDLYVVVNIKHVNSEFNLG